MTNLLTSWNCKNESHLVIGSSNACGLRIRAIIEAGATPTLITNGVEIDELPLIIKTIIEESGDKETLKILSQELDFSHILTLGRKEIDGVFDKVFVSLPLADYELKKNIYEFCLKNRIPINTSDSPEFCTFTILSTYSQGDFQVGVTTNGKGCKLASRIKREIVSSLPVNIGEICSKVGQLRERIQQEDCAQQDQIGEHDEDAITTSKINSLVEEFKMTQEQVKLQRTRWLSQVVEYYPLNTLASVSIDDLTREFKATKTTTTSIASDSPASHKAGSISLVGSGPGSVSLLTVGAIEEIFSADLILADKLVPQQVLDIIPQNRTNLFIAKKFPGNAERAQEELLNLGLEALQRGEKVVRLKQGDPYIFGRGGEEYTFFAANGFEPKVLPGITLALAAPVITNIPATHRDVADQVLICTGTGRRGALPNLPEFNKTRTTVFLMALHRIVDLIPTLIQEKNWDPKLPVAVIERASSPDQRVIRTTLENVAEAMEVNGSRPPGLLVTGYACEVIEKHDMEKKKWIVEEGCKVAGKSSIESLIPLLGEEVK